MSESSFFGWAVLAATLLGPVSAVFVTRWIDTKREKQQRRLHVLRTLMATRRAPLSPEHVNALNLIEIEFYGKKNVLESWKKLLEHFSKTFDPKDEERVARERENLKTKLLSDMARVVGYRIEQLEIISGGYMPQYMVNYETEQQAIRRLFAELANGNRALPVEVRKSDSPHR